MNTGEPGAGREVVLTRGGNGAGSARRRVLLQCLHIFSVFYFPHTCRLTCNIKTLQHLTLQGAFPHPTWAPLMLPPHGAIAMPARAPCISAEAVLRGTGKQPSGSIAAFSPRAPFGLWSCLLERFWGTHNTAQGKGKTSSPDFKRKRCKTNSHRDGETKWSISSFLRRRRLWR